MRNGGCNFSQAFAAEAVQSPLYSALARFSYIHSYYYYYFEESNKCFDLLSNLSEAFKMKYTSFLITF